MTASLSLLSLSSSSTTSMLDVVDVVNAVVAMKQLQVLEYFKYSYLVVSWEGSHLSFNGKNYKSRNAAAYFALLANLSHTFIIQAPLTQACRCYSYCCRQMRPFETLIYLWLVNISKLAHSTSTCKLVKYSYKRFQLLLHQQKFLDHLNLILYNA